MVTQNQSRDLVVGHVRNQKDLSVLREDHMFIITDKTKVRWGGGSRCRCYERRRAKLEEIETSHTLGGTGRYYVVVIHT